MFSQKLSYITFKTTFECTLYVMSLILTLDFTLYALDNIRQLTGGEIGRLDVQPIRNLQYDTGLRQVNRLRFFAVFLSKFKFFTSKFVFDFVKIVFILDSFFFNKNKITHSIFLLNALLFRSGKNN